MFFSWEINMSLKKFSDLLENSKTHVISGCGHMIMIEKAFEMREKILKFLNS